MHWRYAWLSSEVLDCHNRGWRVHARNRLMSLVARRQLGVMGRHELPRYIHVDVEAMQLDHAYLRLHHCKCAKQYEISPKAHTRSYLECINYCFVFAIVGMI